MNGIKQKAAALIIVFFDFLFMSMWDEKYQVVSHQYRGVHPSGGLLLALALIFFSDFFESQFASDRVPAFVYKFLGWVIIICLTPWFYYRFLISN